MLAIGSSPVPPVRFVEVGPERGIETYRMSFGQGAGIAAADYDDDGDVDLFVPNRGGTRDQLYRNRGDGHFDEIAADVDLDSLRDHRAALWIDYDGDRDLDLVTVEGRCELPCNRQLVYLYRQEADGRFTNATDDAGLTGLFRASEGMHAGGIAAADFDRDGWLDLYICFWEGEAYLLRNDGQGGFVDVSAASGLDRVWPYWQPVFVDLDGDGWLDIYQNVDFAGNMVLVNQHDGTFVDQAPAAGADNAMNDMGVTVGDPDNDGDFDVYVTNVTRPGEHNILLRNDTTGTTLAFTEISQAAGCDEGGWGWGTTFLDVDRDGLLDIAATNGAWEAKWQNDPSRFYRNLGESPMRFADVSTDIGFDDTDWGSCLIAFDADRDGDLDLAQACANGGDLRLLDNRTSPFTRAANWVTVRPRMMRHPNYRAIGAVVRVTTGGVTQSRVLTAGVSFLGQEPAEAHFGLGSATTIDRIDVEWPDGATTTTLVDVDVNEVVDVFYRLASATSR